MQSVRNAGMVLLGMTGGAAICVINALSPAGVVAGDLAPVASLTVFVMLLGSLRGGRSSLPAGGL